MIDKNLEQDLAIVILNYKNYELTIKCISKLIDINITSKIIVIDNNSPNESYNVIKDKFSNYEKVTVIASIENGGYAKGNNIGIRYAIDNNYKYIAIMNPDIIIEEKFTFNNIILAMEYSGLDGITALPITNNYYDNSVVGWKIPGLKELLLINLSILSKVYNPLKYKALEMMDKELAIAKVEVMPGCFFILTSECFNKINFFDENTFLYYEENILSYKAKKNNCKFGVSLNNFYIHNHEAKDEELIMYTNKTKDRKIVHSSQYYYANEYLKLNIVTKLILNISQWINLYIELPIIHFIKIICIKLKNNY